MYNNTINIKSLIPNTDYLLFKKGVRPEWEDPMNKAGGKWVVTMPIEDHMEEECEQAWENLIVDLIGGQFGKEEEELINGIIFSIREKHLRLSLWVKDNNLIAKTKKIGQRFKDLCMLPEQYRFGYLLHVKAIKHDLDNTKYFEL